MSLLIVRRGADKRRDDVELDQLRDVARGQRGVDRRQLNS